MTVFYTVLAGFLTFVLGQLAIKLLVEPIHEFRRVIADIAFALTEYANIYCNPGVTGGELETRVSSELRTLSSRLNSQMYLVPRFDWAVKIFGLPSRNNVEIASTNLIGLSNSVNKTAARFPEKNLNRSQKICDALGIHIPEHERVVFNDKGEVV